MRNQATLLWSGVVGWVGLLAFGVSPLQGQCGEWTSGGFTPGMNEAVHAMAEYDDGGGPACYVGGEFTRIGALSANHIAKWDGSSWSPLGTGSNNGVGGSVSALVLYNGELIVGGRFASAGGVAVNNLAKWNGSSWSSLGSGSNNGISGGSYARVDALAVLDGKLIVGGSFTAAGGVSVSHLAQWDGTSWSSLDGSAGSGVSGGTDPGVKDLTVFDGKLIVGGSFSSAYGISVKNIVAWDGSTWSPLGIGASNGVNGPVNALTVYDGQLIAGGYFVSAGGAVAEAIARWDGAAWSSVGIGVTDNWDRGYVYALTVYQGELIAGGRFTRAGGIGAVCIAKWDGSAWSSLGDGARNGTNGSVMSLAVYQGELMVGGAFTVAGALGAHGFARWNGASWLLAGEPDSGVAGVSALAVYEGELIAAGEGFLSADGSVLHHVGRWDGSGWQALGGGVTNGVDSYVNRMTLYDGRLVVAGAFRNAGGVGANLVAQWNGASWSPLGEGPNNGVYGVPEPESSPSAAGLTVYNGELVVGGYFTMAGGVSANYIAKWNGTTWSALGSGMSDRWWPGVGTLTVYNGELIAGGGFGSAGGVPASNIARWDGTAWSPLGSGVTNDQNDCHVAALTVYGGELIVGGMFTNAGGISVEHIAKWNGSSWSALGSGVAKDIGGTSARVNALAVYNDELIVGGDFTTAGGITANYVARWNGSSWAPLGSRSANGVGSPVSALAVHNNELIVGGGFNMAGGQPAYGWARWNPNDPSFSAADFNHDCAVDDEDMIIFAACATGSAARYDPAASPAPLPGCPLTPDAQDHIAADLDTDGDVDMDDFASFQRCLSEDYQVYPSCGS